MASILVFGAGKSASVLIEYLAVQCNRSGFTLEVVDAMPGLAEQKISAACRRLGIAGSAFTAKSYSIDSAADRSASIQSATVVISLLPPHLHAVVAADCLVFGRSLFTASYLDAFVEQQREKIREKGLLFLYEMGLDPGIDHMSLIALLEKVRTAGGVPVSIRSHCGGLVAPESDNNPWHYKISWNPRNIVLAGLAGARFLENSVITHRAHEQLFSVLQTVEVPGTGELAFYPNRDSLNYLDRYQLTGLKNFQRTTLRHPDFIRGWNQVVKMGLIDEKRVIELMPGTSLASALQSCAPIPSTVEADIRAMLEWLGWADHTTIVPYPSATPASILQFAMEQKWVLNPGDRDRIVMLHEIEYRIGNKFHKIQSWLVEDGQDSTYTAMAKTVGLPLGMAAVQYLRGGIRTTGLQIPILPEIYTPVLKELESFGIVFEEQIDQ